MAIKRNNKMRFVNIALIKRVKLFKEYMDGLQKACQTAHTFRFNLGFKIPPHQQTLLGTAKARRPLKCLYL